MTLTQVALIIIPFCICWRTVELAYKMSRLAAGLTTALSTLEHPRASIFMSIRYNVQRGKYVNVWKHNRLESSNNYILNRFHYYIE